MHHAEPISEQAVFRRLFVAAIAHNEEVVFIDRRRAQLVRSGANADKVELAYRMGLSQLRTLREFPGALLPSSGEDEGDWN